MTWSCKRIYKCDKDLPGAVRSYTAGKPTVSLDADDGGFAKGEKVRRRGVKGGGTVDRTEHVPIPMSICPVTISFAICEIAVRPDEHCLLTVLTALVLGIPAARAAIRAAEAPPPGGRTLPTEMSSMSEGSREALV